MGRFKDGGLQQLLKLGLIVLVIGLSMSACSLFPGDPGPPIAVQGSGSDSLGAALLLLCPNERLLSLTISENVSKGSEVSPGKVLWKIEASEPSTMSEFTPGIEPAGFRTVVAALQTIAGDIVISFQTTHGVDTAGVRVRPLPTDVVRFQGREMTKTTFYGKRKDAC